MPDTSLSFAIVGDTQRTTWPERIFFGREQNDAEREYLLKSLAQESPDFVVMLGDMVAQGASPRAWNYFDAITTPISEKNIPMHPVLGNHDYWGPNEKCLSQIATRFSEFQDPAITWHAFYQGALGMVFLDTNKSQMSASQWERQQEWFNDTLAAMDKNPLIKGVIVFSHHPPFTNSQVTSDEKIVLESFLPAFQSATKTMAFISGHAHGYEHFIQNGKHMIVSGGGGGPRVRHKKGDNQRHEDQFSGPSPRPFHYLCVNQDDDGLKITVQGFDKGESEIHEIDAYAIPFPSTSD